MHGTGALEVHAREMDLVVRAFGIGDQRIESVDIPELAVGVKPDCVETPAVDVPIIRADEDLPAEPEFLPAEPQVVAAVENMVHVEVGLMQPHAVEGPGVLDGVVVAEPVPRAELNDAAVVLVQVMPGADIDPEVVREVARIEPAQAFLV